MKPGDRVGDYELIRRIGRGGMAEVYLARKVDDILQKDVVVKLMHSHLSEDERFIKMFLREARIASRMYHQNVVQVFEVGQDAENYFLAMEYLDGASLQSIAGRAWGAKLPVPFELVARSIGDAALGLHYAHTLLSDDGQPASLVHRDISPDNLFVTRTGTTKVLDFGIATGAFTGRVTRTGELKGKVRYMSPEQIDGLDLDSRSDIFSLGVTAYRLLTGHPPFDGTNELQIMRSVVESDPKLPSEHNPHLPRAIDDLVMNMLAKDRDERVAAGEHVYDVLNDFDGGSSGRQAMTSFIETVMALPPNNKLEVPTWVTAKRPAAAPVGTGVLEARPVRRESADDPTDGAAESSQPETAELGEAAAKLRSQTGANTVVRAVDVSVFEPMPDTNLGKEGAQDAGEQSSTLDATRKNLPAHLNAAMDSAAEGFEATIPSQVAPGLQRSRTPALAVAAGAFVVGIALVIALASGDGEPPEVGVVDVAPAPTGGDATGGDPTGDDRTGDDATGDDATGDDTGDDATGDDTTRDEATGDEATGDDATGDEATGDDATGDDATGDDATGDDATGDEATGDDATGDDATGDEATGEGEPGDDEAGDDETGDDAAAGDGEVESGDAARNDDTRRRTRRTRRKAPAKTGPATLVFRVVPFGTVFLDGSKLGTTPLQPAKVAAGRHLVLIKMNDKKKRVDVKVAPGERRVIRVNMNLE